MSVLCYSGRTEFQSASMNRARRSVRFERKPSQRYSRRPNFDAVRHDNSKDVTVTAAESKKYLILISVFNSVYFLLTRYD